MLYSFIVVMIISFLITALVFVMNNSVFIVIEIIVQEQIMSDRSTVREVYTNNVSYKFKVL